MWTTVTALEKAADNRLTGLTAEQSRITVAGRHERVRVLLWHSAFRDDE